MHAAVWDRLRPSRSPISSPPSTARPPSPLPRSGRLGPGRDDRRHRLGRRRGRSGPLRPRPARERRRGDRGLIAGSPPASGGGAAEEQAVEFVHRFGRPRERGARERVDVLGDPAGRRPPQRGRMPGPRRRPGGPRRADLGPRPGSPPARRAGGPTVGPGRARRARSASGTWRRAARRRGRRRRPGAVPRRAP